MSRRNQQRIDNLALLATRIREHCACQLRGELESPREFLKGLHNLTWEVQKELGIKRIKTLSHTWGMTVTSPDSSRSIRSESPNGEKLSQAEYDRVKDSATSVPADGGSDSSPELIAYLESRKLTLKKGTWWMIKSDVNSKGEQKFGAPNGLPHLHGKRILTNGVDCLIELDNGQNHWVILDNWVFDPAPRGGRKKQASLNDDEVAKLVALF